MQHALLQWQWLLPSDFPAPSDALGLGARPQRREDGPMADKVRSALASA